MLTIVDLLAYLYFLYEPYLGLLEEDLNHHLLTVPEFNAFDWLITTNLQVADGNDRLLHR